jgi:hypothetical protein
MDRRRIRRLPEDYTFPGSSTLLLQKKQQLAQASWVQLMTWLSLRQYNSHDLGMGCACNPWGRSLRRGLIGKAAGRLWLLVACIGPFRGVSMTAAILYT